MSTRCPSELDWTRHLTGELGWLEARRLVAHVSGCPGCRETLAGMEAERAEFAAAPRRRQDLAALQTRSGAFRPFKLVLAAAAALVLLLLWAATLLGPARGPLPPFVQASLENHMMLVQGELPLEIESGDARAVAAWFRQRLGSMPDLPALSDGSIELVGGRLAQLGGEPMALISYRVERSPVTLAIVPRRPATEVQGSDFSYVQGRRFTFSHQGELHNVAWSDGGNNFSLTSVLGGREMLACKVCHGRGSGLTDIRKLLGI